MSNIWGTCHLLAILADSDAPLKTAYAGRKPAAIASPVENIPESASSRTILIGHEKTLFVKVVSYLVHQEFFSSFRLGHYGVSDPFHAHAARAFDEHEIAGPQLFP